MPARIHSLDYLHLSPAVSQDSPSISPPTTSFLTTVHTKSELCPQRAQDKSYLQLVINLPSCLLSVNFKQRQNILGEGAEKKKHVSQLLVFPETLNSSLKLSFSSHQNKTPATSTMTTDKFNLLIASHI